MRKSLCLFLIVTLLLSMLFSATVFSASADVVQTGYGDEEGSTPAYEWPSCEPEPTEESFPPTEPYYPTETTEKPASTQTLKDFQYQFRTLEGGTLEVYGHTDTSDSLIDMVIPAKYNGKAVTSIAGEAFKGDERLVSLTIPENIASIGAGAFSDCTNLKTIRYNAIRCSSIGSYETEWSKPDIVPAFDGCTSVSTIQIADKVESIPDAAFFGIKQLGTVTIPKQVVKIGAEIFGNAEIDSMIFDAEACYEVGRSWVVEDDWGRDYTRYYHYYREPFYGSKIKRVTITDTVINCPTNVFSHTGVVSVDIKSRCKKISGFIGCRELEEVTLPQSVEEIESSAFADCTKLAKINLPAGIRKVGYNAFGNTAWLENQPAGAVYINNTLYQYKDTGNADTVTVRDGTTDITMWAFSDASVKRVILPDSLTDIDDYAFYQCASLEEVRFGKGLKRIGMSAFFCCSLKTMNIPDSVESIGERAFQECKSLSSIVISKSIKKIGHYTFCDCNALETISLPEGIEQIGEYAFSDCDRLKEIVIPDTVTKIGNSAFSYCGSLKKATVGKRVAEIGSYAFSYCSSLETITLPNSLTAIEVRAFTECSALKEIAIPNSVKALGGAAFYKCTALKKAVLGSGITAIEPGTFYNCSSLETVVIPDSIKEIKSKQVSSGDYGRVYVDYTGAFENCTALKAVTIPDSVTGIENYSFKNCTNLSRVQMSKNITHIQDGAFYQTAMKSITIKNPTAQIGYKAIGVVNSVYGDEPMEGFVMYGYKGSSAEKYAKEYKLQFVAMAHVDVLGDTDGDGDITIVDATCIQRVLAELAVTAYFEAAADADGDGDVTIMDATAVQRYLAELPCFAGIGKVVT